MIVWIKQATIIPLRLTPEDQTKLQYFCIKQFIMNISKKF